MTLKSRIEKLEKQLGDDKKPTPEEIKEAAIEAYERLIGKDQRENE
jgi:hypothetical protein